ncbi:MAG: hypothetical protein A3K30_03920 [Deltaproteobacteria bacterium RBG_13_51_10]|nr:MAG: hypothetical protein A3K30_03920 [Deltaproteobacteria bacterium RBG_13_51_10]
MEDQKGYIVAEGAGIMAIHELNYLRKTYNAVTQVIVKTKQRLGSLPGEKREEKFDSFLKGEKNMEGLETVKGRITRQIEKAIKVWDIWELWLEKIPGIGPYIGAELIIHFYYRFIPICKKCGGDLEKVNAENSNGFFRKMKFICSVCGKPAKGDGTLIFRIEDKDFPTISKWWAYMGRHTVDGVMPKRKAGIKSNWGTPQRTLGFHIGEEFNKQDNDHPYKKFLIERKQKHEGNHSDPKKGEAKDPSNWSKDHRHNAAKNEAVKLFLSHFWVVARILQGKPLSEPYAGAIMGHKDIIKPFYWTEPKMD